MILICILLNLLKLFKKNIFNEIIDIIKYI